MRQYQLIIFDWDGTLMNSEARIVSAIQVAAERCGFPVLSAHDSKQIIGLSLHNAILGLYPLATATQVQLMADAYSQHFLEESTVEMTPFDGAESLLLGLKMAGIKTAIATGKSRRGLDQILKESGFGGYFNMTRTPFESASKPDPLMLKQILAQLNVPAEEALMVGDTTFDLQMASNINMDRVAMSHGVHAQKQLEIHSPLAHFDDLQALHHWLTPRLKTP